jgi:cell volume regulation protein A
MPPTNNLPIEFIVLIIAVMLLLSVLASKASGKLGVPALLLFLGIGMLAGSDGVGGIYFDNPWLAQLLGSIALAYILFAGGLQTQWKVARPILAPALVLSTFGVILTATAVGLFTHYFLHFTLLEGLLLGAVVSSTDAAAVFSILRSKETRLRGKLEPLLEMESGSNDPMAVFLTLGFTHLLSNPDASALSLVPMFFLQFGIGSLAGFLIGKGSVRLINGLKLTEDGLYPVLTTAIVIFTYGLTTSLRGNGFLAVYLAGLILGNSGFIHKKSLTHFHDGLAWLMQIVMFLILGLQVFPSQLPSVAGIGLLIAAFLILIARPLSVFAGLLPFKFRVREKAMIAWVGLRGAAPIVLATFPLLAGLPESGLLFHLVFFVVLVSVLLQGSSVAVVARWLGVNTLAPTGGNMPLSDEFTQQHGGDLVEITIPALSQVHGKRIVDLQLPESALVVLIKRGDDFIIPRGDIVLRSKDRLLIAADSQGLSGARQVLQEPRADSEDGSGQP